MASSRKSKSDLIDRVADTISPVVPIGSSLLVGLSGGVDSVVLLHLLSRLSAQFDWQLSALHVHHGISRHADAWVEFCRGFCTRLRIPLVVEHVDITPLREMGIEAAARKLRHAALSGQAADFVVLAHHRDDQIETMLLQMLRGAGVRGAAAMPLLKLREEAPALLRPLLELERSELERYAVEQGLRWVEDDSNADVSYPRNFLRHQVLPLMADKFPSYRTTLARSAGHFAEAADLLEQLAMLDADQGMVGNRLDVAVICRLNAARGRNLLRHFLLQCGAVMPDSTRLEEILRQVCSARQDARVEINWQGWQLRLFRGHIHVFPALQPPQSFNLLWHGEERLVLPGSHGVLMLEPVLGSGLNLKLLQQQGMSVRARAGGEHMRLAENRPRQSVKNLLHESGLPPWLREQVPLIYCGNEVVAIPGVAISKTFCAREIEQGIMASWSCLE